MTDDRKATAWRLIMQAAVLAELKGANDADRARVLGEVLEAGDAIAVTDNDGTKVGRVRVDAGKESWRVTDMRALTDWMADRMPDSVETTVTLRKAELDAILKAGEVTDPWTGEVLTPPGIELKRTADRLVVTQEARARELAAELLNRSALRAIEEGTTPA